MMYDEYGWFYFCDRLGDTYRWRGENVSTVEIEDIISSKLESAEVVVYGVEIPGQEGRAGMAAIIKDKINIEKLTNDIKNCLPTYARPVFLRIANDVEHTGSKKFNKKLFLSKV
jgi:solute carrier family 27 fatty acid transporter 1/4